MKKLFTLIGGLVLLSKLAIANDPSLGFGQFSSREFPNQNGKFPIEFNWELDEDREMIGKPEFNLPHGWKLFSTPVCYPFKSLSEKRVIKVIGILLYPHKTLPFFPQEIKVTQSFKSKSGTVKLSTSGIVYFTPYRTTELWSAEDFADLSRVWHTAQSQIDTNRRFIARKSIPKSDVKQDYQVLERWQDDLQMIFVKGLAYSIPRKAIHPDTLEAMYERGEVEEFQADDPPESISTFARVGGKTFDGSVSGRLVGDTIEGFDTKEVKRTL